MDKQGIHIKFGIRHCFTPMEILTDYTLHTGIPIKYIRQYILETIRTIPFHHSTVHGVYYIRVYRSIVLNDIFQRPWKLFNFTLILFIMCIIYGYADGMCLSMYSRDYRNYSLLNGTVHSVHQISVYRYNVSVSIFQRL